METGPHRLPANSKETGRDSNGPKPDLYVALPIVQRSSDPRGFHRDDSIQNFTYDSLAPLEEGKNGLISNPITPLDTVEEIDEKNLVCFPCAVVEIKHHRVSRGDIQHCYRQAANGASTALSMLHRLSYYLLPRGPEHRRHGEIRPTVAFTFIGPGSRVWIVYISKTATQCREKRILCEYVSLEAGDSMHLGSIFSNPIRK